VTSPHYDPPETSEPDYVVLGIIASKSSPIAHKRQHHATSAGDREEEGEANQAAGRANFMVLRLTDLKWEIDLFLFGTGFSQFWKLVPGTVIAILNPGIMPPRNKDSGNFSLKVSSSEDVVLEIGTARDLGFCTALRKDGKECMTWIDKRKTEVCEFHISLAVEKVKRGRMEVNTMVGMGKGTLKDRDKTTGKFTKGNAGAGSGRGRMHSPERIGQYRLREWGGTNEMLHIVPSRSTAQLIDEEDRDVMGAMERGMSRAELSRKRIAERERERSLAKKLGAVGHGLGSEYLRVGTGEKSTKEVLEEARRAREEGGGHDDGKTSAGSFGLLGKRAEEVRLSPVKRKRSAAGDAAEPMGWGGAFKRGLLMKEGEGATPTAARFSSQKDERRTVSRDPREQSPVKKKARLLLEGKGIREPGRESLGGPAVMGKEKDIWLDDDDEDDDDELEIV
jgi:minichromosome maintenance protein 10